MSIRARAMWGAILLFGGLLVAVGASVTKSNARIQYERDVERQKPDPRVPENGAANVLLALGLLVAPVGIVIIAFSLRDMGRQIGDAQSRAEQQMRMAVSEKRDPKP